MSSDSALPSACERCASLLMRGTTMCRVCGWDSAGASAPAAPVAPVAPAATYGKAPVGYGAPAAPAGPPIQGNPAFGATAVPVHGAPYPAYQRRWPAPVGLGRAVASLVRIVILLDLVLTLMTWLTQRQLTHTLQAALSNDSAEFGNSAATTTGLLAFTGLGWLVYVLVFLATGVVTVVWTFQAHRNAVARGTYPQRLGEGWAIAGWLVPFVWLVVPFIVVTDIWRANDPELRRNRNTYPTALVVWWVAWVVGALISAVTWLQRDTTGLHINPLTYVGLVSVCVSGAAFVHILRTLTTWQQIAPVAPAQVGAPV